MLSVFNEFELRQNQPVKIMGSLSGYTFQNVSDAVAVIEASNNAKDWIPLITVPANDFKFYQHSFGYLRTLSNVTVAVSRGGIVDTSTQTIENMNSKTPNLVSSKVPVLLYATSEGGEAVQPLSVSDEGHLEIAVQNPATVFGESLTASLTPVIQGDFAHGLIPHIARTGTMTGTGNASFVNQLGTVSTGASANSSAIVRSKRIAKYRAGQGVTSRFTSMFSEGEVGAVQLSGMYNQQDGFGVGLVDNVFVCNYRRNNINIYHPQNEFILDKLDGSGRSGFNLNPNTLNIFRLQYGYLGVFGCIFSVINLENNQWVEFHFIPLTNSRTTPQFINPSLWFQIFVQNTTNTTDVRVSAASFSAFVEGKRARLDSNYGTNAQRSVSTTRLPVLTIKTNTTLNGVTTNGTIRLRSISLASAANVPILLQAIKNATLGGTPSFVPIDSAQSLASVDTAATTVTGGNVVWNTTVGAAGHTFADVSDFDIDLHPDETLTLASQAISGAANVHLITTNWSEDI